MSNQIITGEKLQQLCNVYFGFREDFDFNPVIKNQRKKQFILNNLNIETSVRFQRQIPSITLAVPQKLFK